ncbi:MAG: acyl-CoA dehydrogenase family protein [Erythrobacter sp.]|uniref:acyl-CoA dehydrogenase family protein n=1 Tax=Erythrobacter sp. TaxID=1042 RepID=UPI0025E43F82|nr:acyl-CoA dehydrogenase family protein [Erythrobacter sp.]MCL9999775.1 acyl-CoA dehydrogenase family protein [Erythrobacter sp.]
MDFVFTDEQRMIAETAQAFFTENATSERTRAAMASDGIDHALWQAFCQELGLSGIGIAENAGGAGLGLVELAIIAEAAGAQVAPLPLLGSLALAAQGIAAGASDVQRAAWLPALLSGETIAAHMTADDLVADGDRITASSAFVAHGSAAGLLLVSGAGGSWLVRADAPGVTVTAQTTMDQTRPFARIVLAGAESEPLPIRRPPAMRPPRLAWWCSPPRALVLPRPRWIAQSPIRATGCSSGGRSDRSRPTSTALQT